MQVWYAGQAYVFSDVSITTKHKEASVASKLSFTHNGEIYDRSVCARQTGTTVTVTELFKPLPVRRKEFQRNSKNELIKMINSVQAFALSRRDVKFSVVNALGTYVEQQKKTAHLFVHNALR